jgi:hypothetical protein
MPRPANAKIFIDGQPFSRREVGWNVRAYYAVKYLLIGGILAALLATAFA